MGPGAVQAFLDSVARQPRASCLEVCGLVGQDQGLCESSSPSNTGANAGSHILRDGRAVVCTRLFSYEQVARRALERAKTIKEIVCERQSGAEQFPGIEGQTVVAVGVTDVAELLVCKIAVLLAGHVYVPFDPLDPRCAGILHQCNATIAIVDGDYHALMGQSSGFQAQAVSIQELRTLEASSECAINLFSAPNLGENVSGRHISHTFFTSGSTGEPKGVIVSHASLSAFVHGKVAVSQLTGSGSTDHSQASRIFLASAPTFDPHFGDTLAGLSVGATLIAAPKALLSNGLLMECLRTSRASHVCLTPTVWGLRGSLPGMTALECQDESLTETLLPDLKELSLGGEPMPSALAEAATTFKGLRVVNTYGVTEATVYQATYCVNASVANSIDDTTKLIGAAYPGSALGLNFKGSFAWMDFWNEDGEQERSFKRHRSDERPCEHTIDLGEGEILIRGPQVGNGYLGLPKLTSERFLEDAKGSKIFRTGDLGRILWAPVGPDRLKSNALASNPSVVRRCTCGKRYGPFIRWIGRADTQIKHLGVRIEVEEIEAALRKCKPLVERCAVVKHTISEQLTAFIVNKEVHRTCKAARSSSFAPGLDAVSVAPSLATALRMLLSKRLPQIMVPTNYFVVASLTPATSANGKLDRFKLGSLDLKAAVADFDKGSFCDGEGAPLLPLERIIANAWSERLGIAASSISAFDSFRHLGGDSLDAQRVAQGLIKLVGERNSCQVAEKYKSASHNFGELIGGLEPVHMLESSSLQSYAAHLAGTPFGTLLAPGSLAEIASSATPKNVRPVMDDATRALYACAAEGDILGLTVLIDPTLVGQDPDAGSCRKNRAKSPLHVAAANGHVEAVKVLLAYGANVFATSEAKVPPSHVAAGFAGDQAAAMLKLLFQAMRQRNVKAPTAVRDGRRQTILHAGARGGSALALRFILSELANDFAHDEATRLSYVNCIDRWNRTALHWAVVNNNEECVKVLLESGAKPSPNLRPSLQTKSTHLPYEKPIDLATRKGFASIASILRNAISNITK